MIRPRFVFGTARLYRVYSRTLVGTTVILQRGRYVEKVKAPKHRPFHRCYNRSFKNRLGVDAKRNSDGVHWEKSGHESDQPGEPFPTIVLDR